MLCLIFPSGSFSVAFLSAWWQNFKRNTLLGWRQGTGASATSSLVLSVVCEGYTIHSGMTEYQVECLFACKMLLFWILRLFCICPYCRHSATPINRMCMQYLRLNFYAFGNTVYVVCLGDLDIEIAFLVSRFHCSLDWGKALCWRSKALSRQKDSCISLLSGVLLKVPFNCQSPLWG